MNFDEKVERLKFINSEISKVAGLRVLTSAEQDLVRESIKLSMEIMKPFEIWYQSLTRRERWKFKLQAKKNRWWIYKFLKG